VKNTDRWPTVDAVTAMRVTSLFRDGTEMNAGTPSRRHMSNRGDRGAGLLHQFEGFSDALLETRLT
jgi:hypothetical protein